MSNDKAAEARKGLLDGVKGKAKEVAGAMTGKDALVEEGQLQQAEAKTRKEAAADEAIAEAKRHEAAQELTETNRQAAQQKNAAKAKSQREESAVDRERANEHAAAAREAKRVEAAGAEAAEENADALAASRLREAAQLAKDAETTEQKAAAKKLRLEREATAADKEAAILRADTKK